jgi:hypothetical protein
MKSKKNFLGKKRLERYSRPSPEELERQEQELTKLIQRLSVEVFELVDAGLWSREEFVRIWKEAFSLELKPFGRLQFLFEDTPEEWYRDIADLPFEESENDTHIKE